ncbi:MAG: cytochrome c oxidase subunit 3 [Acidimicrobiia bacterium]|nr:cytochrome c oxidase subunit 3 [Acidimicrobiia bacterium]
MAIATSSRPPSAILPRARTVQVGTAFAVGATLMYFGALIGIYLDQRQAFAGTAGGWIPDEVDVQLTAPSIILWTFFLTVPIAQWAVYSIGRDDRKHAYLAFGLTILLGLMTINQAAFNFDAMGLVADRSRAETLIFLVAGSHIAITIIGLLFFLFTGFRALAGQFSHRYTDAVAAAAMYWYVVVFLYFVIWLLIYVTK